MNPTIRTRPTPLAPFVGALLGSFFAVALPAFAAPPDPPDDWVRLETPHFVLFGDAQARKVAEIADELERLRAVLGRLTRGKAVDLPAPTRVYVFRSNEEMTPFKPRWEGRPSPVAGWFLGSEDENLIALSARWNDDPRPLVFHEFVHEYLHAALPPAPQWFDEGVAEYYSTFQSTGDRARVGRPVEHHVRLLSEVGWMPIPLLFSVRNDSPEYNEADKQGVFYAESWAVVHYLLNGDPSRSGQLGRLFEASLKGPIDEATFRRITGDDFSTFEGKVRSYVRGGRFPFSAFDLDPIATAPSEATPVAPAEALARLGALLDRTDSDRGDEAEEIFRAALALDPRRPVALSGLAAIRERQGAIVEAGFLHREAIASPGADAVVWYRAGAFLLRTQSGRRFVPGALSPETCDAIERARAALEEALRIDPGLAIARARLGSSFIYEPAGRIAPGIPLLEEAVRRLPHRRDLAFELEELRRRDRERPPPPPSPATHRTSAPPATDDRSDPVRALNDLLARKKWDAAERYLKARIRESSGDEKVFWQEQYDRTRPLLAKNRLVERYNRGVSYLNRQRLEEALTELRVVAESKDAGALGDSARDLVRQIEELLRKRQGKGGGG